MKYIAKFIDYIDESTFMCIIALALFILVGGTFSNFLVTSNNHRASEMYIGELKYNVSVDNINSNIIVAPIGISEYDVVINSLNDVNTYYKIVYPKVDGITIKYRNGFDKSEDLILNNGTKRLNLVIENNTSLEYTLDLKVVGGYEHNGLDAIGEVVGYSFMDEIDTFNITDTIKNNNTMLSDKDISFNSFDGNGLYSNEDIYYFRGNVNNNYVMFANKCFRILRTNEDGSVRLIYSGEFCSDNINSISNSEYNINNNDNAYFGYMTGIKEGNSNSYEEATSNKYNSKIKDVVDNWYLNNIVSLGDDVTSMINNSVYCNDRSIYEGLGYSNNETVYNSFNRFKEGTPSTVCTNKNDMFTVSGIDSYGNNALTYPVGLITIDEIMYAGLYAYDNGNVFVNENSYLYNTNGIHSMSPYGYFNEVYMLPYNHNVLTYNKVNYSLGVYPVISIKKDINIISGLGTINKPYILK